MPRQLRVQYPGAMYHVMSRGNRREDIFLDDVDRQSRGCGIKTLAEACQKTGWQVHAYCLMSNHYHLVLETPQLNLVFGMKWLLGGAHYGTEALTTDALAQKNSKKVAACPATDTL